MILCFSLEASILLCLSPGREKVSAYIKLKYNLNDKVSCPTDSTEGTHLIWSFCILNMIILINININHS